MFPAAVDALFETCSVQVAVCPCVKVPVCAFTIAKTGAGSMTTLSVFELVAVMPPPLNDPWLFALAPAFEILNGKKVPPASLWK